jgi:hypothetical protein
VTRKEIKKHKKNYSQYKGVSAVENGSRQKKIRDPD